MPDPTLFIVAALARQGDEVLLVAQQGPDDAATSWMLPGGRVEQGESLAAALARELSEETGLRLTGINCIAFAADIRTGDAHYSALTFDVDAEGSLAPSDPDGFVRSAEWVPVAQAFERLRCVAWYDCEPLALYLGGQSKAGAVYVVERE